MKCKFRESCGHEICIPECCPEFEGQAETNGDRIRDMGDEELARVAAKEVMRICQNALDGYDITLSATTISVMGKNLERHYLHLLKLPAGSEANVIERALVEKVYAKGFGLDYEKLLSGLLED